ncbi:SACA4 protein, partial [Amia calva]|nr:SACA4 protein [Amia calva]
VLMGFLSLVQGLQCYECLGFYNLCVTLTTTCSSGQSCFQGRGQAAGFVDIIQRGCLANANCNQLSNVTFQGATLYKMNKTCCATDLCNAAPATHISALSAIAVVTAWLTTSML